VKFLLEKGFKHYSVRDYLIEEIEKRGMEVDRNSMVFVANDLREKNSSSYIVEELYRRAEIVGGNVVIESIRTSGEIELLREKGEYVRPGWDEYFINISRTIATRGTCDRGRSGAVIAKDKQILVTGYVGSPKGLAHCDESGHLMEEWKHSDGVKRKHCVRTTHAEQNAICQAAKLGISISGATLYCKMLPCSSCAGMIINSGIKKVICEKKYHAGGKTPKMFEMAGVELEVLDNEVEKYFNQ
jgi:dCMP deaminase